MARVKELPCACCSLPGPSHAHHVNSHAMGAKASDFRTIPLCDLHHDGGVPGESVHAGLRLWPWSEERLVEQTWRALMDAGIVPKGAPAGEPYEAMRRLRW